MSTQVRAPLTGRIELASWDETMSWLYLELEPEGEDEDAIVYIVSKRLYRGRFSRLSAEERRRWVEIVRKEASGGQRTLFGYADELFEGYRPPPSQIPLFVVAIERSN